MSFHIIQVSITKLYHNFAPVSLRYQQKISRIVSVMNVPTYTLAKFLPKLCQNILSPQKSFSAKITENSLNQ